MISRTSIEMEVSDLQLRQRRDRFLPRPRFQTILGLYRSEYSLKQLTFIVHASSTEASCSSSSYIWCHVAHLTIGASPYMYEEDGQTVVSTRLCIGPVLRVALLWVGVRPLGNM